MSGPPAQPVFYYDLGSPRCYIAAERVISDLPVVPEWEPVQGPAVVADGNRTAIARLEAEPDWDRSPIECVAAELELQPLRWPRQMPPDTRDAMLAATYAKRVGRVVVFSLAAFRQAFAGGRDLGDPDTVLIAAAASEMHPTALLKGMRLRSVADALSRANERALSAGVRSLPAIQVGGLVLEGDGLVERAALALGAAR
jgi:2-hydroxychromene-2-carboxylate isomerase